MSLALVTPLQWATPAEWVDAIATDTLALLSDHAHCELKAAASAQSLIVKNTQRPELIKELLSIAHEELQHFGRVVALIEARGGTLAPVSGNRYAGELLRRGVSGQSPHLLDRLIVAALIEARSLERFRLLADHLQDEELSALYADLLSSEASHRAFFLDAARKHFSEEEVSSELERFAAIEAEVIRALPFDHLVHSGPPGAR
jgi:tRNA-(ms[2]io[6]A)-hydroxylase